MNQFSSNLPSEMPLSSSASNETAAASGTFMLTPLQISLLLNSYAAAANSVATSSLPSLSSTYSAASSPLSFSSCASHQTLIPSSNSNNLIDSYLRNSSCLLATNSQLSTPSLAQLMPTQNMIDVALQLSQHLNNRAATVSSPSPPLPTYSSSSSSSLSLSHNNRSVSERTKLFVGNLPDGTALVELFELFKPYGHLNHQLCVVKEGNYAFIHFFSERAAEKALQAVNGVWFRNRYLRVEYSVSNGHLPKKFERSMFFVLF